MNKKRLDLLSDYYIQLGVLMDESVLQTLVGVNYDVM